MPAAAMIGGGLLGAYSANKSAKSAEKQQQAAIEAAKMDPRASKVLYGDSNGAGGLLDKYRGLLDAPQSAASQAWAQQQGDYLSNNGAANMGAIHNASMGLMQGNSAPMATAAQAQGANAGATQASAAAISNPAWSVGSMVNAPSQNGVDLKGSYDRFVNGTPGANQYLDQGINGAIAQNRLGFQQLQDDATKNLMQNILPSIRGSALGAGQFGSSRQGIAEGNALGTMQTEMARAASQFGQNATNAAVNAKANAYESDSNRALSATQGLGAQQYGVAQMDANTKNQAEFMNVNNAKDILATNAGWQQQTNLFNAGNQNQMNQYNAGQTQQNNQFNAGLQQQAGLANQGAQLNTNAQNNSATIAGGSMLGGLLGQASGAVNAQDNYALNRAGQVNGLLAPYLSQNGGGGATPMFQSTAGQTMSGAMSGLALGNQLAGMFGTGTTPFSSTPGTTAQLPTGWAPSQLPVQGFPVMGKI